MSTFPRFFNAEELGKSLKEVATDLVITTHQDVISRWFHSAKDADLFIWLDKKNNVLKQQLTFFGQVVEWNVVEGLKTGLIVEDERQETRKRTEIVHFDSQPQQAPIEQALALLNHITALKDQERLMLAANFQQLAGASTTMPAEMFIERFGSYLGDSSAAAKSAEAKPGLWQRLWRLIRRAK